MYDPDKGRWLSADPYGQYHSPYMAMNNAPHMSVDPDGGWSPYLTGALVGAAAFTIAGAIFDDDFSSNWWKWTLGGAAAGAASVWGYGKITNSRWEKGYATIVDGKKTWHNRGWKTTGYTKAIPGKNINLIKTITLGDEPAASSGQLAYYIYKEKFKNHRNRDAHKTKSAQFDFNMGPENVRALRNKMRVGVQSGDETVMTGEFDPLGSDDEDFGAGQVAYTGRIKNKGQLFSAGAIYQHPSYSGRYQQPTLQLTIRRQVRVKRNHLGPRNGANGWHYE